jgi:hypothetical protein
LAHGAIAKDSAVLSLVSVELIVAHELAGWILLKDVGRCRGSIALGPQAGLQRAKGVPLIPKSTHERKPEFAEGHRQVRAVVGYESDRLVLLFDGLIDIIPLLKSRISIHEKRRNVEVSI